MLRENIFSLIRNVLHMGRQFINEGIVLLINMILMFGLLQLLPFLYNFLVPRFRHRFGSNHKNCPILLGRNKQLAIAIHGTHAE